MVSLMKIGGTPKHVCRLCYYETTDTTDAFSEKGIEFDFVEKITKYLYLHIDAADELPKTICWMCTQQLDSFHKFYTKINEIQRNMLNDKYEQFVLQPQYITTTVAEPEDLVVFEPGLADQNDKASDDDHMVEVLLVSDEYAMKCEDEESVEEYEILEVDQNEFHASTVLETKNMEIVGESGQLVDGIEIELTAPSATVRRSQRRNRRKDTQSEEDTVEQPIRKTAAGRHDKTKRKIQSNDVEKPSTRKRERERDVEPCSDEDKEGESGDEFPARDSDNDDWPAQQTISEFPKEILRGGLLLIKGHRLMSMISKFYLLECDLCEDKPRFKQFTDLLDHYTKSHNEKGYVKCCQTKLIRYPAIIMHMARHLQPEAFQCDVCGYTVTRARFLETHKQTHLPDDQKPYVCDKCDKRFCWKNALNIHMIQHQPVDERRQYVCQLCGKSYNTPGGLSTHKRYTHLDGKKDKSNVCHICAKNFATRTGLNEHMATIHQPREKAQVQCPECGKWLMNNRCLRSHLVLHSEEEIKCDKCDYVTKKPILLKRHILTRHTSARPFVCDLCGRSFKMKRALTIHLAQHGTTRTFRCQFCERIFNSSTNFYAHRKSKHPKELAQMKEREEELQRRKRIKAGVEKVDGGESATFTDGGNDDDDDESKITANTSSKIE